VLPILVIGLAGSVGQGAMNLYATGLDMESLIPRLTRTQTTLLTSLVGYIKSRGSYDPHDLQVFNEGRTGGRYWYTGGWNLRATTAWIAGSTVGLLTVSTTLFAGPLAGIAGGVDISLVSSTLVAAAVYALAERS
jgi:purine-cytosine permease-like protein